MTFELSNNQREYFGIEPIEPHWEKVPLNGDAYRPASILYFDGEIIKRRIISTHDSYEEKQYNEATRDRTVLLPKTGKGKEKKLSGSVLEARQANGVYCEVDSLGRIFIGDFYNQTTFYDTRWEQEFKRDTPQREISDVVAEFIKTSPSNHLTDIAQFKNSKRKHCKFKPGDYFSFKVGRTKYGFGRVLLDIDKLRKKSAIAQDHGLFWIMGKPVLVKIYAYISENNEIDIALLERVASLPSSYMLDNLLLYGQFEIIGHQDLKSEEIDLPMSYGRHVGAYKFASFLQWGLIHRELPSKTFDKYTNADNPFVAANSHSRHVHNPYGFYAIGFYPYHCSLYEIETAIAGYDKDGQYFPGGYRSHFDLRNPANKKIGEELMTVFGLDPEKSYDDNCVLTGTISSKTLMTL